MQKRSLQLEVRYVPVVLDPSLPIRIDADYPQNDEAITSLHVHNCLELGLCHEGQGIFMVGEKILEFEAGDVVFINQSEVHLAQSAPGTQSRWTWIYLDPVRLVDHPAAVKLLDPGPICGRRFRNIVSGRSHPEIVQIIERMIGEHANRRSGYIQALKAQVWELMILFRRMAPRRTARSLGFEKNYDRLAPALQILAGRYTENLPVRDLARPCGLSEPHFRRLFRQTLGVPPLTYRNDLRMRMALSLLLSTTRSILEISQGVGFESLSSFNRQFRSGFGVNPTAWRKSQRQTRG